jgi:hypothetical protein
VTPTIARRALAASLALGLAASYLLDGYQWRFGFVAWVLVALGAALLLLERSDAPDAAARRDRRLLFGAAGALALLLVLRDAPMLYVLDFFALVVTCALIAWRAGGRPLSALVPRDAIIGGVSTLTAVLGGAPTLALRDADARSAGPEQRRSALGFGLGTVVAAPVLLAVTGLLASADPVFAAFADEAGTLLETQLAEQVLLTVFFGWVTAGAMRGAARPVGLGPDTLRREFALPFAGALPLLGGLALLLSAWIGLQLRMLFGGDAYLSATAGMTVAEYARSGFFELVVIAGIVLAALLVADDVVDRADAAARAQLRTLGLVLVGLVAAVLVSAVVRLELYVQHFGLTADRVFALALLVWVALVLAWFGVTLSRGVRERFAPGVLLLSALWLLAFNVSNPERWVVETNLRRAAQGAPFDVAYHVTLSADAEGALREAMARLDPTTAEALRSARAAAVSERAAQRDDWRDWSLPFVLAQRDAR